MIALAIKRAHVALQIRVDPKLAQVLREQATKERRTVSSVVIYALSAYLAKARPSEEKKHHADRKHV